MQEPGHGPNTTDAYGFLAQIVVLLGGCPSLEQLPAVIQAPRIRGGPRATLVPDH